MQNRQFSQIGIVGAGDLGKALGTALNRSSIQVIYYDIIPSLATTPSIDVLVRACEIIILCVPSWAVPVVGKDIRKVASPSEERMVVSCAKGVAPGFVTMDKILADNMPRNYHTGLMFGPMAASEIHQGKVADGILALTDNSYYAPLRSVFAPSSIFLEASGDLPGVAACGALKNIYALALGMSDGLKLGINAKSRLVVLIIQEMRKILEELGANPATADGTAGLGDLICSTINSDSFNYRIGKSLAEGIVDPHVKSEGIVALHELNKRVKLANFPIANILNQAAFHFAKPQRLTEVLL